MLLHCASAQEAIFFLISHKMCVDQYTSEFALPWSVLSYNTVPCIVQVGILSVPVAHVRVNVLSAFQGEITFF